MDHLYKFQLKKVEAALRLGFREISRYLRHLSSAEPDVGCVYHHTIQRWTIYISSDSKKLKRRYGLAFEKFRDIRDIYRVPNRMSGVYTIILYIDEPFLYVPTQKSRSAVTEGRGCSNGEVYNLHFLWPPHPPPPGANRSRLVNKGRSTSWI